MTLREMIQAKSYPGMVALKKAPTIYPTQAYLSKTMYSLYNVVSGTYIGQKRASWEDTVEIANSENLRMEEYTTV